MSLKRLPFVILFFTLMLCACAPRPQDCARADVFCAGLVTASGPIGEGINQEAWLGLQDAKAQGLVDRIDHIDTVDPRDLAKNISFFAEDGYDVIITIGPSLGGETLAAAQKYPEIKFIGVEQEQAKRYSNLTGLVFHEDQSGFLAGALAAMITQTGRVGAACDAKFIDSTRRSCDGFQAGAVYVNPKIDVLLAYRALSPENVPNDPTWGSQAASQMVGDGADVLFAAGGTTADSALETAAGSGVYVIGSETDVYPRLPAIHAQLVSSAVSDIRSGVLTLIRLAKNGGFPAGDFFGPVGLAPFHDLAGQFAPSVSQELDGLRTRLAEGSIHTNVPYQSP